MNKYKISASKGQKKYSLVLTAESENQAKERVHSEGYSILNVAQISDADIIGNKFIFKGKVNGKTKTGTIIGDDIFKIYIKLKDDLGYTLESLYPEADKDLTYDELTKIFQGLKNSYDHSSRSNKQQEKKIKKDIKGAKKSLEGFHMKKELDETYALINTVIEKLQALIVNPKNNISDEKREKINGVYNSIIKIKTSTNIEKLKQVGEAALLKIGDIELETLESQKNQQSKKLLSETNKLLKQVGSSTQFKEKNKDIKYIFSIFTTDLENKIENLRNIKKKIFEKSEKKLIDKESYSFLKTLLLLDKYKQRLKLNNQEIFKNISSMVFPFLKNHEKREKILLKRKVIQQNISLLKAKKSGKIVSYTGVIKGYKKIIEKIISLIRVFDSYIFYVITSYSILFVFYLNMVNLGYVFHGYSFNYTGVFYFVFLLSALVLTSISRGLFVLTLNFVILFFILIFGVVNF